VQVDATGVIRTHRRPPTRNDGLLRPPEEHRRSRPVPEAGLTACSTTNSPSLSTSQQNHEAPDSSRCSAIYRLCPRHYPSDSAAATASRRLVRRSAMPPSSPVSFASGSSNPKQRTVILGAGFLASYITRQLVGVSSSNEVLLASRNPERRYGELKHLGRQVLAPARGVDIARPGEGATSLESVLEGASTVINLVGSV